jgi:hypothetical protein
MGETDVLTLYHKWGGSARLIFQPGARTEVEAEFERLEFGYLRDWLATEMKADIDNARISSHFVRIYTEGEQIHSPPLKASDETYYHKWRVDFASPYVLLRVIEKARLLARDRVAELVDFAHISRKLSRVVDNIFEQLCLAELQKGAKLTLYSLEPDQDAALKREVRLPKLHTTCVVGLKDFTPFSPARPLDAVQVPLSSIFPAIDFVIDSSSADLRFAFVNVTLDCKHAIKWVTKAGECGLKESMQHICPSFFEHGSALHCPFLWLVPVEDIGRWKGKRKFTDCGKVVHGNTAGVSSIRQYVATIGGLSKSMAEDALKSGEFPYVDAIVGGEEEDAQDMHEEEEEEGKGAGT